MLKSIFIFGVLFVLIGLGVYIFFRPEPDPELSNRYSEYLSGALSRSIASYDVEFDTSLFLPQETQSPQEFIENLNASEFTHHTQNNTRLLSYNRASQEDNASAQGNFGTPTIPDPSDAELSGLCDGGLIYDPCVVLGKPIRATGGMNFGS